MYLAIYLGKWSLSIIALLFLTLSLPNLDKYFLADYLIKDFVLHTIIFLLSIIAFVYLTVMIWYKKKLVHGFEEVKDLIRGTITADTDKVWKSYLHFKSTPGITIVEIKDLKKIESLQNITVLFEFEQRFIGEM